MSNEDLLAKGRAMRRQLLGAGATDRLDADVYTDDPVMEKFGDLTQEVIFGILWSRPGLDLKTRSLITAVSDSLFMTPTPPPSTASSTLARPPAPMRAKSPRCAR